MEKSNVWERSPVLAALRMQFTDLRNRVRSFCSRIQVVRDWKDNRSQVGISEHSF